MTAPTKYKVKRDTWHYKIIESFRIIPKIYEKETSSYNPQPTYQDVLDGKYKNTLPRSTCDYANALLKGMFFLTINLLPYLILFLAVKSGMRNHPAYFYELGSYALIASLVTLACITVVTITIEGFGGFLKFFGYDFDKDSCGMIEYE